MKNALLTGWNFIRLIRLALGIFIIVHGIQSNDWSFIALGALFTVMPLLNIGCCSTTGCNLHASKNSKKIENIPYEDI